MKVLLAAIAIFAYGIINQPSTASAFQLPGAAPQNQCMREFAGTVRECGQSLRNLPGRIKAKLLIECLKEAVEDRKSCANGPTYCEQTCNATHQTDLLACQASFDMNTVNCGENAACTSYYTGIKQVCDQNAANGLQSCLTICAPR